MFTIILRTSQGSISKSARQSCGTQFEKNNYSQIDKLVSQVKTNIDSIDDGELKNEIIDNVEGLQEELKKEKPKKGIINAIVKALESIIPKIPEAIELTAAITQIIAFVSTL